MYKAILRHMEQSHADTARIKQIARTAGMNYTEETSGGYNGSMIAKLYGRLRKSRRKACNNHVKLVEKPDTGQTQRPPG